jgi:hypothetical protein
VKAVLVADGLSLLRAIVVAQQPRKLHTALSELEGLAHALPRPRRPRRAPAEIALGRRRERNAAPDVGTALADEADDVSALRRALGVRIGLWRWRRLGPPTGKAQQQQHEERARENAKRRAPANRLGSR